MPQSKMKPIDGMGRKKVSDHFPVLFLLSFSLTVVKI